MRRPSLYRIATAKGTTQGQRQERETEINNKGDRLCPTLSLNPSIPSVSLGLPLSLCLSFFLAPSLSVLLSLPASVLCHCLCSLRGSPNRPALSCPPNPWGLETTGNLQQRQGQKRDNGKAPLSLLSVCCCPVSLAHKTTSQERKRNKVSLFPLPHPPPPPSISLYTYTYREAPGPRMARAASSLSASLYVSLSVSLSLPVFFICLPFAQYWHFYFCFVAAFSNLIGQGAPLGALRLYCCSLASLHIHFSIAAAAGSSSSVEPPTVSVFEVYIHLNQQEGNEGWVSLSRSVFLKLHAVNHESSNGWCR